MKKLISAAVVALTFLGAFTAQAASHGSAIIPAIDIHYGSSTAYIGSNIYLTNITNKEITCTIKP